MSALEFLPVPEGRLLPHHCGRVIRFGEHVSACFVCAEQWDTHTVAIALLRENNVPATLAEVRAATAYVATTTSSTREASEAIAKAMGK